MSSLPSNNHSNLAPTRMPSHNELNSIYQKLQNEQSQPSQQVQPIQHLHPLQQQHLHTQIQYPQIQTQASLLNSDKLPNDMIRAKEYLNEPLETYKQINLSEQLLERKQEEDEGVQPDSDFEGEDFEDLLELFEIDPDETSLDLSKNEQQKLLLESMDNDQLNRYEFFRRSNLNPNVIRRFVTNATGQSISNDFAKLISGIGKVFIGEITEKAKEIQRKSNEFKVLEQLKFKEDLKRYELKIIEKTSKGEPIDSDDTDLKRPILPSFYQSLLASATSTAQLSATWASQYRFQTSYLTAVANNQLSYDMFQIIIPDDNAQLSPDDIRQAWNLYQRENNTVINGRWRQQGGGNGLMFR